MKHKKFFYLVLISIGILLFPSLISYGEIPKERTIYLTFDDGPSKKPCNDILDVLKEQNVKATFFLVGSYIAGNENTLIRIYNEGHALGLHSMTHEKKNLYNEETDFINEMLSTQDAIFNTVGVRPTILRFPFGCNNNTYRLKKSLVDKIHRNNLKIYDWTLDSGDGEFFSAHPSLFIKNSISKTDNITLLMHCGSANKNSPLALKEIIKYYKYRGYTFKTITPHTPEIFHYLK